MEFFDKYDIVVVQNIPEIYTAFLGLQTAAADYRALPDSVKDTLMKTAIWSHICDAIETIL